MPPFLAPASVLLLTIGERTVRKLIAALALVSVSATAQLPTKPYYAVPPNPEIAAICASENGLALMWERQGDAGQRDLRAQYDGWRYNVEQYALNPSVADELGIEFNAPPPTFEEFRDASLARDCADARDGIIETFERATPFVGAARLECDADWDEKCDDSTVIRAPKGYQICRASWRETKSRGDTDFSATAQGFLPDKLGRTARFTEYAMKMHAYGSGAIFDREGARIRVENFFVTMVPAEWPDEGRRKLKCHIAQRPTTPSTPPTAPTPVPTSRPLTLTEAYADGKHTYRFRLDNPNNVAVSAEYVAERWDSGATKPVRVDWGTINFAPNGIHESLPYHGWTAVRWQIRWAIIR